MTPQDQNETFVIQGLSGKKALNGELPVRGAKNAVIKACAASLLFKDELIVSNIPHIEDVFRMKDLLEALNVDVSIKGRTCRMRVTKDAHGVISDTVAKRLRASVALIGPLLARFGSVSFPHPGGCIIGARPIDLFLEGFKQMGATLKKTKQERYELSVPGGRLTGASLFFKNQTVTGTETFMMAGVLAKGKTILKNSALEPEIKILADFLNQCGAKIEGAGTPTITIQGGGLLSSRGVHYKTPPDRIEAGSFIILGALLGKQLTVSECEPKHLESLLEVLRLSGISFDVEKTKIHIRGKQKIPTSVDIKTHEYPGFPTDIQAPMAVFLTQAKGSATIFETIFDGRFRYVDELIQMGATIDVCDPHRIIVHGPTPLCGKELESPDLRAGLAYVVASLVAKGESVIHNVYNIDRGYENIEERLGAVGAPVERII